MGEEQNAVWLVGESLYRMDVDGYFAATRAGRQIGHHRFATPDRLRFWRQGQFEAG
jgi:hypothetical protein